MSKLDHIADSFKTSNRLLLGAEGALLGSATTLAEGVPGAQLLIPSLILADVTASMTLLSRQTCLLASVYGSLQEVLKTFPMSSQHWRHTPTLRMRLSRDQSSSRGLYSRDKPLHGGNGRRPDRSAPSREGSSADDSSHRESSRTSRIAITQKELGILVPVAGAVLNGSINLAFQKVSHQTAKDYFRRLLLEDRYGDETRRCRDFERNRGVEQEDEIAHAIDNLRSVRYFNLSI
jgi:hypothetical protein